MTSKKPHPEFSKSYWPVLMWPMLYLTLIFAVYAAHGQEFRYKGIPLPAHKHEMEPVNHQALRIPIPIVFTKEVTKVKLARKSDTKGDTYQLGSMAETSTTYNIECWYLQDELVARLTGQTLDMIVYFSPLKKCAKYWEKKLDPTIPRFVAENLDANLADLFAYFLFWLEKFSNGTSLLGGKRYVSPDNKVTTVVVCGNSAWPGRQGVKFYGIYTFVDGKIAEIDSLTYFPDESNGIFPTGNVRLLSWNREFNLPTVIVKRRPEHCPPPHEYYNEVISLVHLEPTLSAAIILPELIRGYRPVKTEVLNAPRPQPVWGSLLILTGLLLVIGAGVVWIMAKAFKGLVRRGSR